MKKNDTNRRIVRTVVTVVAIFLMTVGGGAVANAVTFGTTNSPMNLVRDGVRLGQGKGEAYAASNDRVRTSSVGHRDSRRNGDGVFMQIRTDYASKYYSLGRGPYYGTFHNNVKVRTSASESTAWRSAGNGTFDVVQNRAVHTLNANKFNVDFLVCEDRGIFRTDPCLAVTKTIYQ